MPRQIYRMGQDIYNAATNTRIGATDWSQNWSGQSDVQDLGQRNIPASPVSNLSSNQPNIYDTSSLANTNVNIPPQTTNRYDNARNVLDGSINSTSNSLSSFLSQFDSYTQPAETERTGLVSKMNTAIDKLVGRGKRTQDLMTEQQLPQNYEQLKALNLQIAEKKAAYDKSIQDIEGKNIPMPFITGQQAQVQKMANIELGNMATLAQALQGNIELSRQMINDTVNLEYADTEQEIENLQYQLTLNEQNMTSAEKKRAEAMSFALTERQAQIDAEKEEKTQIRTLAIEAAKNGASADTAQRMMSAKTLSEAIGLGGTYLQTADTQVVNAGGRQKLINTKTGAVIADLGYSQDTSPSISEQIAADAGGFTIEGGKIIPKDARTIVSQSGQAYDMSTYAADPAQAQAVQGYLNQIGKFNSVEDIDAYINQNQPNSTVTGEIIANASSKYGIGWEELTALMQHEALLGTSNVSVKNNNPGGITWTQSYQDSHEGVSKGTARPKAEGGNYVKFKTMQDGVNAVAQQLARRKTTSTTVSSPEAQSWASQITQGKAKLSDVPKNIKNDVVKTLDAATGGQLTLAEMNKQEAVKLVDELISDKGRTGGTGVNAWLAKIPGNKARAFKNKTDRLLGLLTLDQIKLMKGFGTLSDAEGKRLENSAAILKDRYVSEEEYLNELLRVKQVLSSSGTMPVSNSTEQDPLGLGYFE